MVIFDGTSIEIKKCCDIHKYCKTLEPNEKKTIQTDNIISSSSKQKKQMIYTLEKVGVNLSAVFSGNQHVVLLFV